MTTVFVAIFADEGPAVVRSLADEDCSVVLVSGEHVAKEVNRALPGLDGSVCVTSGARFQPGAVAACVSALEGSGVVSPLVMRGAEARPWHEPVSPLAFFIDADALRMVGGLDERVVFGYHRFLARAALSRVWRCAPVPDAVVETLSSAERDEALGNLYYRQIADNDLAESELAK